MGVTQKDFVPQGPQSSAYFSNNYTVNSLSQAVQGKSTALRSVFVCQDNRLSGLKIKEIYSPHSSEGYKSETQGWVDGVWVVGRVCPFPSRFWMYSLCVSQFVAALLPSLPHKVLTSCVCFCV